MKDKVYKNTIAYILTVKRRQLPALWSSIPHLHVCHLHFNYLYRSNYFLHEGHGLKVAHFFLTEAKSFQRNLQLYIYIVSSNKEEVV